MVLMCGGGKSSQNRDIALAKALAKALRLLLRLRL
jgi:putative component of toxin-antitoxin plasmid stabilization module